MKVTLAIVRANAQSSVIILVRQRMIAAANDEAAKNAVSHLPHSSNTGGPHMPALPSMKAALLFTTHPMPGWNMPQLITAMRLAAMASIGHQLPPAGSAHASTAMKMLRLIISARTTARIGPWACSDGGRHDIAAGVSSLPRVPPSFSPRPSEPHGYPKVSRSAHVRATCTKDRLECTEQPYRGVRRTRPRPNTPKKRAVRGEECAQALVDGRSAELGPSPLPRHPSVEHHPPQFCPWTGVTDCKYRSFRDYSES
jgi:hypothetical protein